MADNIETGESQGASYPQGAYTVETLADGTIVVSYTAQGDTYVQRYVIQDTGDIVAVGDSNGAGPAANDTLNGGRGNDKLDGVAGNER